MTSESKSKPSAKMCSRGCGAMVYFDKDSPTGHPSPDKWIPLEIKEGRRTDVAHNCPKRSNGSTLDTSAATTTTPAIITTSDSLNLEFAETLIEILQDYVKLKLKEAHQN
jgi:hypothetical protein